MLCEDINDGIIKLESKRSHLVGLVDSLITIKKEQADIQADCEEIISKLKAKISNTDKKIKELCDYAVEVVMAEAEVYEAMYRDDQALEAGSYTLF